MTPAFRPLILSLLLLVAVATFNPPARAAGHPSGDVVVVLGDLEGNGEKFDHFVRHSHAFTAGPNGLSLREGFHFVFLGDSIDRGPSAMRIIDALNQLKENHPERVTLLLGNRDLNKLVIKHKFSAIISAGIPADVDYSAQIEALKEFFKAANAAGAFEFRREELAARTNREISENEVFRSFLSDVAPDGRLSKYFRLAQIAYVHEPTKGLFLHGAIGPKSFGYVPGQARFTRVRSWVNALNEWAATLPAEILDYQRPLPETPGKNDSSVIYGRFTDTSNNPVLPPEEIIDMLAKEGIQYVSAGHTPTGDVPVIMSTRRVKFILADNSYSKQHRSSSVRIDRKSISISGFTVSGQDFRAQVSFDARVNPIGRTMDGWRVLGTIGTGGDEYVAWRVGDGFKSLYRSMTPAQVREGLMQIFTCKDLF
ncbi:MAG: metallophosphoesterase [Bdellovibrionota bacterium]